MVHRRTETKANDAPGIPFTLPRSKYTYTNDMLPIENIVDRPLELKEAIDLSATKIRAPNLF